MEKIEIILDNYPQEERNAALVAALKSGNSTLVELALKLEADIKAGGEELFKYAITKCDIELLGDLLYWTDISDNQEALNEGIRMAVASTRTEKWELLSYLIQTVECANVAVEEMLKQDYPDTDVMEDLFKLGAKAHFYPMHLDKPQYQLVAEELFKEGCGKSVEFSNVALEQFCQTVCKNSKQGVVKKLIKDRPDLVPKLTEIAITGGYTATVRTLHQEKALTTVGDELFEKAISKKRYYTVRYLAENGIRKVVYTDVFNAAAFGGVKMMNFLIDQMKEQGEEFTPERYVQTIRIACVFERTEVVRQLLKEGRKCDFDENIRTAAVNGNMEMASILMRYAPKLNASAFDESESLVLSNNYPDIASAMRSYKRKHPEKFQ